MFEFSKRQWKDALRLAFQAAISAALLFVLMKSLGMPEKFVGVISAVLVLSPGLGGTLTAAWKRLAATVIGAMVGVICLWALPGGYGTAMALAVSMLVMSGLAGLFPQWHYGVVAAVALALGAEENALQASIDRSLAIGLGVLVGGAASLVVWPQKSSARAEAFLREAMGEIVKLLDETISYASRETGSGQGDQLRKLTNRFSHLISNARSEASNVQLADNADLMVRIESVDNIHQSIAMIRRVAENEDDLHDGSTEFQDKVDEVQKRPAS